MAKRASLLTLKHRGSELAERWAHFCVVIRGVSALRETPKILAFSCRTLRPCALLAAYSGEASSSAAD